jgi:hypothetical protein
MKLSNKYDVWVTCPELGPDKLWLRTHEDFTVALRIANETIAHPEHWSITFPAVWLEPYERRLEAQSKHLEG